MQGFHQFLQGIIFIGMGLLFTKLIISGTMSYYIPLKLVPFIYIGTGLSLLLGILLVWKSGSIGENVEIALGKSSVPYGIFVITILVGFLFTEAAAEVGIYNENQQDFIKELEQMYGIEEELHDHE